MRTLYYHLRRYWIFVILAIIGIGILSNLRVKDKIEIEVFIGILASIITLFISLVSYYQTNDKFFRELFTAFNERYDKLNNFLEKIEGNENLEPDERQKIIDYLNLCAEEYMWVKRGRIPFHIWKSWMKGIEVHFLKPNINAIVKNQRAQWKSSYYGFMDTLFVKQIVK